MALVPAANLPGGSSRPATDRVPRRVARARYASGFHFISAAINLNKVFAPAYMLLGVALGNLDDPDTARQSFDKALQLNG